MRRERLSLEERLVTHSRSAEFTQLSRLWERKLLVPPHSSHSLRRDTPKMRLQVQFSTLPWCSGSPPDPFRVLEGSKRFSNGTPSMYSMPTIYLHKRQDLQENLFYFITYLSRHQRFIQNSCSHYQLCYHSLLDFSVFSCIFCPLTDIWTRIHYSLLSLKIIPIRPQTTRTIYNLRSSSTWIE